MITLRLQPGELQLAAASRWARYSPEAGEALSAEDELEILRECQRGDWSGYGLLVQRYRRLVWAAVEAVGLDPAQSEDAVQGAFVRAYQKLNTFRFRSSFSSWLYRLARNHALSCLRTAQRRPRPISLEAMRESGAKLDAASGPATALDLNEQHSGAGHDPQALYALAARQGALRAMLQSLPSDQREALNLYYVAEYSYEQIAQALRLPLNTVRTKLHRGKQRLMQLAVERGWNGELA